MVNNLFEFVVSQEYGDVTADLISLYGNLFDKLGIFMYDYEDDFAYQDWEDVDDLQIKFKRILLKRAQDNGIIPAIFDIEESFNIDRNFSIYAEGEDMEIIQDIVTDFKDWTGIELDIIK